LQAQLLDHLAAQLRLQRLNILLWQAGVVVEPRAAVVAQADTERQQVLQ
jgi:hypothetical protein